MKILTKVGIDFNKYDEIDKCFSLLQKELIKIEDSKERYTINFVDSISLSIQNERKISEDEITKNFKKLKIDGLEIKNNEVLVQPQKVCENNEKKVNEIESKREGEREKQNLNGFKNKMESIEHDQESELDSDDDYEDYPVNQNTKLNLSFLKFSLLRELAEFNLRGLEIALK